MKTEAYEFNGIVTFGAELIKDILEKNGFVVVTRSEGAFCMITLLKRKDDSDDCVILGSTKNTLDEIRDRASDWSLEKYPQAILFSVTLRDAVEKFVPDFNEITVESVSPPVVAERRMSF